jgi:Mrp family chromosome partitioning ATPase
VIAGALRQFFEECAWGELDYLLVDMPPGTGDVPLTVFQSLPIEGVVVVSSPQDLVQMVVGKAFNMASMMSVPVLGLVENMAYVTCPHCGEKIWPYGPSHLAQTADEYGIDALGELPIDPALAAACDHGTLEDELPQGFLPKAVEAVVSTCEFDDAKASSGAAE